MARLTQAQLAAQAGISTTAMNNIEHGRLKPAQAKAKEQ
jgi:DNA-binding XRE family transcriptional regulator